MRQHLRATSPRLLSGSDVNKDLTFKAKAKAKDMTFQGQGQEIGP